MLLQRIFGALIATGIVFGSLAARANAPKVAVSIKPIHSLVVGVMEGMGEPHLVLSGAGSPHAQVMRPSTAKALGGADLIFWIGPELERFLNKPLAALANRARVITLAGEPSLILPPSRAGDDRDGDHRNHGAGSIDPHLWLDPRNARAIVGVVVRELSLLDPEHAARYRDNGTQLVQRIDGLDRDLRRRLGPLSSLPFVVFHDAYGYLAKAYGLNVVGFVTLVPGQPSGPRHLHELRESMRRLGVRCVFREPGAVPRVLAVLSEELDLRIGVLDPVGTQLEPGPDLYFRLMRDNAEALAGCLETGGHG